MGGGGAQNRSIQMLWIFSDRFISIAPWREIVKNEVLLGGGGCDDEIVSKQDEIFFIWFNRELVPDDESGLSSEVPLYKGIHLKDFSLEFGSKTFNHWSPHAVFTFEKGLTRDTDMFTNKKVK